jgi:putative copper resistance protein D
VDESLIDARALHFAATLTVAGVAFFAVLIVEPAFRRADCEAKLRVSLRRRLAWVAWPALALTVLSGAAWLLVVAQSMSDRPLPEVFSEGVLWIVLLQTSFGRAWLARFVLACLVAAVFAPLLSTRDAKSVWIKAAAVALTAGLAGSLAWAGHGVGGSGVEGYIHPAADFLHLVAAAAWVGMLVPLALLLTTAGGDATSVAVARIATVRFSNFGIASVGALLLTGSINTWYLAGSIPALTQTDYGRLLLAKVALFLTMVAIAAVNRLLLTPRLAQSRQNINAAAATDALRRLRRNTLLEVAIGAIVIAIVAVLGVTPPGYLERMPQAHHHAH